MNSLSLIQAPPTQIRSSPFRIHNCTKATRLVCQWIPWRLSSTNTFLTRPYFSSDQLPPQNSPYLQIGPMAVSVQQKRTYKENERNMPTAAVSVLQGGKAVGSCGVTIVTELNQLNRKRLILFRIQTDLLQFRGRLDWFYSVGVRENLKM
jgi:hypothetical protein